MLYADAAFANTIAGALAPAISLATVGVVGWVGHRLSKRLDRHNRAAVDSLRTAKTEIRADLKNGIKYRLDSLEEGQSQLFQGQHQILAELDNLKNDPPAELG